MAGQRRVADVDVDADGFLDGLAREVAGLRLRTEADLLRIGTEVQNRARELCPVDTGTLRRSIRMTRTGTRDAPEVTITARTDYAAHVEYGTRHQRAQPYLRPALAEAVRAFGQVGRS